MEADQFMSIFADASMLSFKGFVKLGVVGAVLLIVKVCVPVPVPVRAIAAPPDVRETWKSVEHTPTIKYLEHAVRPVGTTSQAPQETDSLTCSPLTKPCPDTTNLLQEVVVQLLSILLLLIKM